MYNRIKFLVMSTFNEIKNKLKINPQKEVPINTSLEENKKELINSSFEIEEARYMLNLIANSDFKGRDIQVVYDIAFKLQNILQTIND
tara:strand:- start:3134 stop:3397 length:264 start_codon:yes stop_codon:yes gene_type:complete